MKIQLQIKNMLYSKVSVEFIKILSASNYQQRLDKITLHVLTIREFHD